MSDPKETLSVGQKEALEQFSKVAAEKYIGPRWKDYAFVGDFSASHAFNLASARHIDPDASMRTYSDVIDRPVRSIDAKTAADFDKQIADKHGGNLAYRSDEKVALPIYELDPEFKEKLSHLANVKAQFVAGDTAAELAIFAHEAYAHELHDRQHSGANDTPYMAAINSDITEKIACFEEYLTYAQLYTNAKKLGIETLELKDKEVKVDDLLNVYPELKEDVSKNGFDVQNPDCRDRIAKMASEYWDTNLAEVYVSQARRLAYNANDYSLMGAIVNAREWEQRKELMVHNLRVPGNAQEFDAPECLKYFEPSPERVAVITKGFSFLSNEQLIALDDYMDKRGLKTYEEKEVFLAENMKKICMRASDADKDLEAFLLATSSPDKQEILYADNMKVTYHADQTASINDGWDEVTVPTALLSDISKGDLSQSALQDSAAQIFKEQTGEYPPECAKTDAYTIEKAAQFNAYVTNYGMKKQKEQDKISEMSESTAQYDASANNLSTWIQQQQHH